MEESAELLPVLVARWGKGGPHRGGITTPLLPFCCGECLGLASREPFLRGLDLECREELLSWRILPLPGPIPDIMTAGKLSWPLPPPEEDEQLGEAEGGGRGSP